MEDVAARLRAAAAVLSRRMERREVAEFLIEWVYARCVGGGTEAEECAELECLDWRAVSPAILGTLLEQAMAPDERKLRGTFYTAEAEIRRVVEKTVIEPLRAERERGQRREKVRVLDPACGSGNFLVVVFELLRAFFGDSGGVGELLGIEVDPWAARVADLALKIAYARAGVTWSHDIEVGDALVTWEQRRPRGDVRAAGVTERGAARRMVAVEEFVGVRRREWPAADFIVGNPPFLGNKRMRDVLGAGYVAAIRAAYPEVNGSADLVMLWWWRAADLAARGEVRRFGLVTTNSISQNFNREVVAAALGGVRLVHADADLPWCDAGAAVRIAVTIGERAEGECVAPEIHADLKTGVNVAGARALAKNAGLCFQGMNLVGAGFRLSGDEVRELGYSVECLPEVVRPYLIGRDLVQRRAERYVIDFFDCSSDDAERRFPRLWERLRVRVRPERERNNRESRRRNWWLFGEPVGKLRAALTGLSRYIATPETAKHRIFQFVEAATIPDHTIYVVASEDPFVLGVLSSRIHGVWARSAGGTLEDRPRWNNTLCFLKFPFPERSGEVVEAAEALEGLRGDMRAARPSLAWTDVYNCLSGCAPLGELHARLDRAVCAAYGWPCGLADDEVLARLVALNAVSV